MQERGAHEQHPQHGVEGKAPHRAEAFVAMRRSEDRSNNKRKEPRSTKKGKPQGKSRGKRPTETGTTRAGSIVADARPRNTDPNTHPKQGEEGEPKYPRKGGLPINQTEEDQKKEHPK